MDIYATYGSAAGMLHFIIRFEENFIYTLIH